MDACRTHPPPPVMVGKGRRGRWVTVDTVVALPGAACRAKPATEEATHRRRASAAVAATVIRGIQLPNRGYFDESRRAGVQYRLLSTNPTHPASLAWHPVKNRDPKKNRDIKGHFPENFRRNWWF